MNKLIKGFLESISFCSTNKTLSKVADKRITEVILKSDQNIRSLALSEFSLVVQILNGRN